MKKNNIKIASLIMFSLMITACDKNEKKNDELIVATSADYPPFEFQENDAIVGFDIDIAKAFAKDHNLKIKIQDMNFDSLMNALNSNRVDMVISTLTATKDRKKSVDFSNTYYNSVGGLITHKDSNIKSFADLSNKIVGSQLGSTWETLVKEKSTNVENLKSFTLTLVPLLVEELKLNRIDAVLVEKDQAIEFTKINPDLTYHLLERSNVGYAAAFKKKSDLTKKFNETLYKMTINGELNELKKKWIIE